MNPRRVMFKRALAATVALTSALLISTVGAGTAAHAENNGLAQIPPEGWSSWSFIRNSPTEAKIKAQAKGLHDSGLVGHGFQYINLDDYYYKNPGNTVDQYGRWVPDTGKFPDGMANLAAYIHGLGEKFGMYVTPGIPKAAYDQNTPIEGTSFHARDIVSSTSTTESNYGGFGGIMYFIDYKKNPAAAQAFVNSWADLLASYGVDYLKIDGVHESDEDDVAAWSTALKQDGRPIHFELSNSLPIAQADTWKSLANGWQINGDIEAYGSGNLTSWNNVTSRFTLLPKWAQYAGKGGWNDPDSLELGNGAKDGMNPDERQSQMTLWAISAAPLLLGSDLTNLDATDVKLLSNDSVLNVDRAGIPALPVSQSTQQQVWRAKNPDGSYTVALFNLGGSTATVKANFSDLGFSGTASVRDLWKQADAGTATDSISRSLPSHGSALFTITPGTGATAVGGTLTSTESGRCADDKASTLVDATQLQVWDCNGGNNQKITYSASTKTLKVLGKCFDAYNNETAAGTHVNIYDCNGGKNQQWNVNTNGTITGVESGQCLDVTGATNPNGTGLELWPCRTGAQNQQWTLATGVRVS